MGAVDEEQVVELRRLCIEVCSQREKHEMMQDPVSVRGETLINELLKTDMIENRGYEVPPKSPAAAALK